MRKNKKSVTLLLGFFMSILLILFGLLQSEKIKMLKVLNLNTIQIYNVT